MHHHPHYEHKWVPQATLDETTCRQAETNDITYEKPHKAAETTQQQDETTMVPQLSPATHTYPLTAVLMRRHNCRMRRLKGDTPMLTAAVDETAYKTDESTPRQDETTPGRDEANPRQDEPKPSKFHTDEATHNPS